LFSCVANAINHNGDSKEQYKPIVWLTTLQPKTSYEIGEFSGGFWGLGGPSKVEKAEWSAT